MGMYVYGIAAIAVALHDLTNHSFFWVVWMIMTSYVFMVAVVGLVSVIFLAKNDNLLVIASEDAKNIRKLCFHPSKIDLYLQPILCSFFAWYGYIHGEWWLTVGYIGAILILWFSRIKLKNEFIRLEEEFKK